MIFTKFWKEQFADVQLRLETTTKLVNLLFARVDNCEVAERGLDQKERILAAGHHRLTGRVSEAESLIRNQVQALADLEAKVAEMDKAIVGIVGKISTPKKPKSNPPVRRSSKRKTP